MTENRVLIMDDDQRICRMLKRVSDDLDVESFMIDNPELFESAYLDHEPNVILLELQMPKLDGVELLRKLTDHQSKAAIILVSGMDKNVLKTTEDLGKSLGMNMAGFLNKPIDINEAKTILEKHFEPIKEHSTKNLKVSDDELSQAIEQNELIVHYQPQINLKSGEFVGVEALVRWQHPTHGLLFPDIFIPLAEKNQKLISQLTYSVLKTALQDDMIRRQHRMKLKVSVNLSAKLLSDLSLPDRVQKILNTYHLDPHWLQMELTESGAMEDPSLTMDILTRLRLKNIKLSIDDFGTGFSSLVQLYRLPFNEIKIDKSFVMKAMVDEEAASIVRITIELGHSLGLEVVTEGIEDQETFDWLKELGCDIGQGYFISRPVDADSLVSCVKEYNKK